MKCVATCNRAVLKGLYTYGHCVGRYPYHFILLPVLICGVLAFGFMFVNPENDMEELYAPEVSQAKHDREIVRRTFTDQSGDNFDPFSVVDFTPEGTVIFRGLNNISVLSDKVLPELMNFMNDVQGLRVKVEGYNFTLKDVCAKQGYECVIDGKFALDPRFRHLQQKKAVQYPVWTSVRAYDISLALSRVNVTSGILISANSLKLVFVLRQDTEEFKKMSHLWEGEFIRFMTEKQFTHFEVAYSTSKSLEEELDKGTSGDIFLFSLTFTLMVFYASLVSAGGDCVSTRALLANAGVLAAGLGILGSFGLITLVGVRFVNIVGVTPFLTLGIGVDDMFLLMAAWSEIASNTQLTVPERIGTVFKKAGIGITITSLTDCLSFVVGATSIFKSVRNFCIYTGTGVLLCYICNATFFSGCLTLHGRRVYAGRHTITCQKVDKSRKELEEEGRSCGYARMCGGVIPETTSSDQSLCEKVPRFVLPRFVMWLPVRILVIPLFAIFVGVSVWGCTNLRQGIELKDLVLTSSYFHKFQIWKEEDYGVKFPISLVTTKTLDYRSQETLDGIKDLLHAAQLDYQIDPFIEKCWPTSLAKTSFYDTTSDETFFNGLRQFLKQNPAFYNDVVFGPDKKSITASRCHIYTYLIPDSYEQADLMKRMRDVVSLSPVMDFAYHPAFIFFEQFLAVLPSTLQTVGITLAVMFVVTCIFLPHPLIVTLVMVQVLMIVTGVFGFMSLWNINLSSITMIHLIMSVGFSVDFCAHVCAAYMVSEEATREERARDAIIHASGPILNGALSSFIGISVLILADSYIFQTFFKIMLLVIGFGVMHAVFFVPAVLSFIGPDTYVRPDTTTDEKSPYTDNIQENSSFIVREDKLDFLNSDPHDDGKYKRNGKSDDIFLNRLFDANGHVDN